LYLAYAVVPGSSDIAGLRKREDLIRYTRGSIKPLEDRGMEKIVFECYWVVRDEYDRLLGKYISKHG